MNSVLQIIVFIIFFLSTSDAKGLILQMGNSDFWNLCFIYWSISRKLIAIFTSVLWKLNLDFKKSFIFILFLNLIVSLSCISQVSVTVSKYWNILKEKKFILTHVLEVSGHDQLVPRWKLHFWRMWWRKNMMRVYIYLMAARNHRKGEELRRRGWTAMSLQ